MGLFGDEVVELLFGYDTVVVCVCAIDHVLQDGIVGEFSEVLGDFPDILEGDES